MRRLHLIALSSLALVSCVSVVHGGDFWNRFKSDWRRNNAWPQPFVTADRYAVGDYFVTETNNGWRLQNTVGDAYFDSATQELTLAGTHKVKWIVTQAPTHRRAVFVLANESQEVTSIRVASVQQAVNRFSVGTPCEVMLTDRDVTGGSGEYSDAVDRALKTSVPPPRLPAKGGGTAPSPGGGGAGASGS